MTRSTIAPGIILILLAAITGCSTLHHGDSPQQQFMSALQRGNGAEANQMWLNMDAQDRADFSHGKGISPEVSPAEVQAQILRHQKAGEDSDRSPGADMGEGDINSQIIDMPGLDIDTNSGSLQNLPNLNGAADGASPN